MGTVIGLLLWCVFIIVIVRIQRTYECKRDVDRFEKFINKTKNKENNNTKNDSV